MFFLAATLVGWIGGDFVYRKVAAKNIFRASLCSVVGTGTAQKDVAVDSRCDVGYDEQC